MRTFILAAALALAGCAAVQPEQRAQGPQMEAVVTVTRVDPMSRTVWVRGPGTQTAVLVPPDLDIDQIRPGARYRVRYSEPYAVAIMPGVDPSAAAGGATAAVKPTAGAAAAAGVKTQWIGGVVQAIEPGSGRITLRTLDGSIQSFTIAPGAVVGAPVKPGDAVTLAYHQAIASQMVSTPQPERDPAPAR